MTVEPRLVVAAIGLVVASACATKTAQPQTDIMQRVGKVSVSAAVLRSRVNDLVDRSAGRVEATADRISAEAEDDTIRRRALVLKVDAIPAMYAAGFRADPLVAALDVWGFAFQFSQYVESGAGPNLYGRQQSLVETCGRDLLTDADAVLKAIVIRPEYFDVARTRVQGWARANPVEHAFSSRSSVVALLAELRSDDRGVFQTVGEVSDLIENLSERLNTYAAHLPKQARWQAELLVTEMAGAHGVEGALENVRDVGTAARRASDFLIDMPSLIATQREILAAERQAVLTGINDQRTQILAYVTAERLAVLTAAREELAAALSALREERMAVLSTLHQERMETVTEVDAIATRRVDSGLTALRELVDYALRRVAILLIVLMLAMATIAVIAYRLTIGRSARA